MSSESHGSGDWKTRDFVSLLSTAYRSENPLHTLHGMKLNALDTSNLTWLVENLGMFNVLVRTENGGQTPEHLVSPMAAVVRDVHALRQWLKNASEHGCTGLESRFLHFATSLIHLWGTLDKKAQSFCLDPSYPLVCYVYPNDPCNYLWFNVEEKTGGLQLIKHNMSTCDGAAKRPFRVLVHRTWSPKRMDKIRFSFDLTSRITMSSVRDTPGTMQLSVRLDTRVPDSFGKRAYVVLGARGWGHFCVFLTYGKQRQLVYMGYNREWPEPQQPVVHPCMAALHPLLPEQVV